MHTDAEIPALVRGAQGGDTKAYEALYRRFLAPVYSLAFRMTGSVEQAEDLTQDIFVKAWQKLSLFRGESAFFTWLYRLALRICLRGRKGKAAHLPGNMPLEDNNLPQSSNGGRWDTDDRLDLLRAINRLPARTRAAVILFDIEGYTHAEVASLLNIREGTSKALVHRGRQRIKREVQK